MGEAAAGPLGRGAGGGSAEHRASGPQAAGLSPRVGLPEAGREASHGDSCFSSISFTSVGSARLRVAFRTNPISLFIALGFPFFTSITFKVGNCFRGENTHT